MKDSEKLADHFSAILANKNTPPGVYNVLTDALLEVVDRHAGILDPAVLRVALPLALERAAQPTDDSTDRSPDWSAQPEDAFTTSAYTRAADLIADLLEADDTPEALHTALDNFCGELSNHLSSGDECACSPEMIRKHLPAMLKRADERGLVCPTGGVRFEPKGEVRS
jgi:hypothetical protein